MDNAGDDDSTAEKEPIAHDKAKILALPWPIDVLGPKRVEFSIE